MRCEYVWLFVLRNDHELFCVHIIDHPCLGMKHVNHRNWVSQSVTSVEIPILFSVSLTNNTFTHIIILTNGYLFLTASLHTWPDSSASNRKRDAWNIPLRLSGVPVPISSTPKSWERSQRVARSGDLYWTDETNYSRWEENPVINSIMSWNITISHRLKGTLADRYSQLGFMDSSNLKFLFHLWELL